MPSPSKALREGSAVKRAAILTAARELFLSDGFDRTSVDAVSARAGVSKRTVYDYFGDKQTLLQAVVADISDSLVGMVRRTIAGSLSGITDPGQLEDAFVGFSMRIVTDMLGSADYTTLIKLLGGERHLAEAPFADAPEDALGEQLAALTQAGLLATPDPRLAADHLIALTFGVVLNRQGAMPVAGDDRVRPLVVEGVRAFLRAYSA
ncbi:TetR/AcrR family transcriptional regulator [Actinoplanes sp. NBRC 103695]|uniref:TetR/AcrR family transcriptional regulator n=1 Tax=Actinoplanes sp. NBRC 103695 TaxID=3032202 RepID=UPI0024A2CBFD|nr:TetR/AcrR family transcriptional regulator [Actinoplanes sp. NBRC 103695]GLY94599.1 TetR family transcriptional regulator [Actinoplanes sp. NBRC 103695]